MLTIVMYHYVRDLPNSAYPRIKGLQAELFDGQLDHICRHYSVCSLRQVVAAARGETPLPPKACLLTFDDGFTDHREVVLPRLLQRGITGSFYPPVRCAEERWVLDVHKVQFIIAVSLDVEKLVKDVLAAVAEHRAVHDLPDDETLLRTYRGPSRFDSPEIIFVKRLLQHGLPQQVRQAVIDRLFERRVSHDEKAFADELYMSVGQLQEMLAAGMEVGGHGYAHDWLEHFPLEQQAADIQHTVGFLERLQGTPPRDWTMCYPYGSYNETTLKLLRQAGCALGLTTKVGVNADLSRPLELQRLDTNDLPFTGDAQTCEWTRKADADP
jgi:peptidoglycan/xylan/chitin deacetylase (PgdA/CDA1 family)